MSLESHALVSDGVAYLGGAIGSVSFMKEHIKCKVADWKDKLIKLAQFAETQPNTSYAALLKTQLLTDVCHGVSMEPHLQPIQGEKMHHCSANTTDQARIDVAVLCTWLPEDQV